MSDQSKGTNTTQIKRMSWLAVASFAFMILLLLPLLLVQYWARGNPYIPNFIPSDFLWFGYVSVALGFLSLIHIRLRRREVKGITLACASIAISLVLIVYMHVSYARIEARSEKAFQEESGVSGGRGQVPPLAP